MLTALIEYLNVLLEYIDWKLWVSLGYATPKFGHATACYTRVSAVLQVLSHTFTLNNLCLQALVTSLLTNACLQQCLRN